MSSKKELKPGPPSDVPASKDEAAGTSDATEPREVTFLENVIVTIKVLAGFGLLGAALWGLDQWVLSN